MRSCTISSVTTYYTTDSVIKARAPGPQVLDVKQGEAKQGVGGLGRERRLRRLQETGVGQSRSRPPHRDGNPFPDRRLDRFCSSELLKVGYDATTMCKPTCNRPFHRQKTLHLHCTANFSGLLQWSDTPGSLVYAELTIFGRQLLLSYSSNFCHTASFCSISKS